MDLDIYESSGQDKMQAWDLVGVYDQLIPNISFAHTLYMYIYICVHVIPGNARALAD